MFISYCIEAKVERAGRNASGTKHSAITYALATGLRANVAEKEALLYMAAIDLSYLYTFNSTKRKGGCCIHFYCSVK